MASNKEFTVDGSCFDPRTFEADLVIDADGIKRKTVVGDDNTCLGFSNTVAYRAIVPIDVLKAEGVKVPVGTRPHCWAGLGKHLITVPMKNDTLLNVAAHSSGLDGPKSSPEIREGLLKHIQAPSVWSIYTLHPPLKSFVAGKVVLVGDAAHAMTPHLGAGAGQGFEDIYTLYRLLTHPSTAKFNVERALAIYDEVRPSRANMVFEQSIKTGNVYDGFGESKYSVKDMVAQLLGGGTLCGSRLRFPTQSGRGKMN
ncbi:unnamed protein product [Cyclocybe aegerita]|uniref:FAD-binding domain-containing protein n=1 Tax=Cyclocybe aegerita TaxID=1973307 RepID=A0A8S0W9U4_CYCAE|nr:unnamed protein product [Cyclocybe aegerita]